MERAFYPIGETGQGAGKTKTCGPNTHERAGNAARMDAMISQELLDMLVCPVCKVAVVLQENVAGLKCGQCRRVYPIKDDIPIMLVDSARIEAS
jgi:uncharacterized protein YbaR (Trm112 family)